MFQKKIITVVLCSKIASPKTRYITIIKDVRNLICLAKTVHIRLEKILRILWPNTLVIKTASKWRWIGHMLKEEPSNITRITLLWTPEGKGKRGRQKTLGGKQ